MAETIEPIEEELEEPLKVVEPSEALPITPVERTKTSNVDDDLGVHLTKTQLTDLTDAGETTLHIHDGRYFTETEINNFAVKLTGAQSIADVKTFTSFPITPSSAPTTNYQTANKKYVDDASSPSSIVLPFSQQTAMISDIGGTATLRQVSHNSTVGEVTAIASRDGEFGDAWVVRWLKYGISNNYVLTDAFRLDLSWHSFRGVVRVGSYIYVSADVEGGAPEEIIRRHDLDGANPVNMTASGDDDLNIEGPLATDGTYIYIRISKTQFKKLTISGTTLTVGATQTFGNAYEVDSGFGCDGTYLYGYDEDLEFLAKYEIGDGTFDNSLDLSGTEPMVIDGILNIGGKLYVANAGYGDYNGVSAPINIFLTNITAY